MSFTIYPAIDVREGRVVRLCQGDYAQETRYAEDPLALAQRYAAAGATWLHLVDLDAARVGGYTLTPLLQRLADETPLKVQTGGGVRSEADVATLIDAGAARVVIGSLAVREPGRVADWLARFGPERLVLALDARQDEGGLWRLPVNGWIDPGGRELFELLGYYLQRDLRHLLCTDIARDGMLSGPNVALYRSLRAAAPDVALQASGGVRHLVDVHEALAAGCAGVVLGRALLEGRVELSQALVPRRGVPC